MWRARSARLQKPVNEMTLPGWVILAASVASSTAISCTGQIQNLSCLPVFSSEPATRQKCYCTERCPSLQTLRDTCSSGQLQTDPCGICLQCAPGHGELCGGFANSEGVCAGGLGCLVRYQPGWETEHNKTGTCVTEQGAECRKPQSGVSCRPGQLGVPSDFVFCPICAGGLSAGVSTGTGRGSTGTDSVSTGTGKGSTGTSSDRTTSSRPQSKGSLADSVLGTLGSLGQRVRVAVLAGTGGK